MDGKPVWKHEDFHFYSQQGLGVSPILYKGPSDGLGAGLLIMPWDHSSEQAPKEPGWIKPWDQSYVLALDAATGKVRYKAMRGMTRASHATPMVIDVQGTPQLISPAGDFVQAFDPLTGQKLWEVRSKGETPVPSVVYGDGLIFTTSGFEDPTIRATRPGGAGERGDLTATHLVWECKKAVPMIPSFLFADHLLYSVKETGIGLCLEAATGKVLWQERISSVPASFAASPLLAGGHIYYLSEQGETTVIEPGREFKVLTRNPPPGPGGETFKASIAVSSGKFLIRSDKRLYCVEGKPPLAPTDPCGVIRTPTGLKAPRLSPRLVEPIGQLTEVPEDGSSVTSGHSSGENRIPGLGIKVTEVTAVQIARC